MSFVRHMTAMILAAALALSPAAACANFCPKPVENNSGAGAAGMPEDCAEAMGLAAQKERPASHDPDCTGCSNCPALASVKSPALAQNVAASVNVPVLVAINPTTTPRAEFRAPLGRQLVPPANGPPPPATPVILKDILRL